MSKPRSAVDIDRFRPRVFVGSSTEGLPISRAIQSLLDHECEVEIWSQGAFGVGEYTLESLLAAVGRNDFGALVLTADDTTVQRGRRRAVARDNVIFELGLFLGGIGRERTFMVYDRTHKPALPTDLLGVTAATYEPNSSGEWEAALGAASTRMLTVIKRLGPREDRRTRRLEDATLSVENAGALMTRLIALLARSRKVELQIVSTQFGALIDPARLLDLNQDLEDLQRVLREVSPPAG